MPLNLSVIVTTYNSGETLESCLESVLGLEERERPREIIVVDNDSSDDSPDIAESFPDVRLIRSKWNMGLAGANNLGAASASGRSLLFLNPDTRVTEGCFETLWNFEDSHPRAALLGPAMPDPSGSIQSTARTWPTLLDIALRRTPLGRIPGARGRLEKHLHPVPTNRPSRTDWIVGAAMWLTAAGRHTVGLMSEKYFLYFEDVEWCMRAARKGMEVWYVPEAMIYHEGRRESRRPGRALWLHLLSMVRFYSEYPMVAIGCGYGVSKKG